MLIDRREGFAAGDYWQFYLQTRDAEFAADQVSTAGYEAHLEVVNPGFIYVGTLRRHHPTPVIFEIFEGEPDPPLDSWQHVVEVSFTGDGLIRALHWGSDDDLVSAPTPVGPLRLRAAWTGLLPGLIDGLLEDGENTDERLLFQVWPAAAAPRKVLRWWSEWKLLAPSGSAPDGRRQIEGQDEVVAKLRSLVPIPISYPLLPGGPPQPELPGGEGYCVGIWADLDDASWWADGYGARRTLRPITPDEVRALLPRGRRTRYSVPHPGWSDPRWKQMLRSVGYR